MSYLASLSKGSCILLGLSIFIEPIDASSELTKYTWLLVCGSIVAFLCAYGIGANDVANAYASSVGAKSLTIKQAVVLAGIFEFLGAVSMGSSVAKTMRKGIADVECFEDNPGLLMYGMICVMLSTGVWLMLASYFEMPVSTTHSCVGGIIGMTMMARSSSCVLWNERTDEFPYISGVSAIVASWVLSPVASGICAAILYGTIKFTILKYPATSFNRAKIAFPIIVGSTVGINTVFLILKGTKGKKDDLGTEDMVNEAKDGDPSKVIEVGGIVGVVAFVLSGMITPYLSRICEQRVNATSWVVDKSSDIDESQYGKNEEVNGKLDKIDENKAESCSTVEKHSIIGYIKEEINADPHDILKKDELVKSIHDNVERHDPRCEEMFKFIQIFTAIVDSFSHGANDVANAMGPFSAVYITWKTGAVQSEKDIGDNMYWILGIGGVGIVVGLATYGYKIMSAIGTKLVAITPARGSCIELGSAFVIIFGTMQGWPLSTTHCQIGATVGVGLFEGMNGVNLKVLGKSIAGWVITLVVVGLSTAMLVGPNPEPRCFFDTGVNGTETF